MQNLTANLNFEFHPHGISFFTGPKGSKRLFVINHRAAGHFVEIFSVQGKVLEHLESISNRLMTSPNDIAAVGLREFYITNDHGNSSAIGRMLEDYLVLARSYVLHFNGREFKKAAAGFKLANGIAAINSNQQILVSSTTGGYVRIFNRNPNSSILSEIKKISFGSGLDNIDIAADNSVWIAAHPQLLTFIQHKDNEKKMSPSQIFRFNPADNQIKEVYLNNGSEISGSSVAATYQNRVLVGAVFERFFLDCTR